MAGVPVKIKPGVVSAAWAVPSAELPFDARALQKIGISERQLKPTTERASLGWEPQERQTADLQQPINLKRELKATFELVQGKTKKRTVNMYELLRDPWIAEITEFATEGECDYIVDLARRVGFEPSRTSLGKERASEDSYTSVHSKSRTSWSSHVTSVNDAVLRTLQQRIASMLEENVEHLEPCQVLRYEPGQQFKVHHDGHFRKYTALLYLNDVESGGETELTNLGCRLAPTKGNVVIWRNCDANNEADMRLLHAGLPVVRGVKYCIPFFFHYKAIRTAMPHGD